MLPYLSIGPFLLPMAGLALLLGIWLGSWLVEKEAARLHIKSGLMNNLIFIGLIGGLIGARIAYAARFLDAFLANPLDLVALTPSTLSPGDGLIIGLLVSFIYGQRKSLHLRPALDAIAPGLAVFLVFLGVAHLLSGDAYGSPARVPWAVFLWGEYRHPTQVYEILLALGILLLVLKHPLEEPGRGLNFWMTIALSAAAQIFLDAFRGDSLIWAGGFRSVQVIGLVVLAVSLWLIRAWGLKTKPEEQEY